MSDGLPDFDPRFDLDITGLDHDVVLAALYNNTVPVGLGFLHADPNPMTTEQACAVLDRQHDQKVKRIDYLLGRPIKAWFDGNILRRCDLYDRNAPGGERTAQAVIMALRVEDAK